MALHEFPWNSKSKSIPHLKGHFIHVDKSGNAAPRAAIYASNNLNVWGVPKYTNRDMATIVWLVQGAPFKKIYVTSTYHMDHSNDL